MKREKERRRFFLQEGEGVNKYHAGGGEVSAPHPQ